MSETTTRTITAAEAAQDAELWEQVRRGEARVTNVAGKPITRIDLLDDVTPPDISATVGTYEWMTIESHMSYIVPYSDDPFTVTDIPPAEQSPNSPAAVERLQARVAELEAQNAALREYFGEWFPADLARYDAGKTPIPDSTAPASASDTSAVDEDKREAPSAPQNGTDAPPGTTWDAGGNLRAVDDGGWMDEL